MRTFLFAVAAVATLASPAAAATRNFGITSFEKVRVEGPFKVTLTTGVAPFARASGSFFCFVSIIGCTNHSFRSFIKLTVELVQCFQVVVAFL